MNTEITDEKGREWGWVCYDADCPMCRRWTGRFENLLNRNGFRMVPLQSSEVRAFLKLPDKKLLEEMRVITPEGAVFGGADAFVHLARTIPGARVVHRLATFPGVPPILRAAYRWIARNRSCDAGACKLPEVKKSAPRPSLAWLPLLVMTAAALVCGPQLPAWAWMWTICIALFLGFKWLTFKRAVVPANAGVGSRFGYLFFWVGMDAAAFFGKGPGASMPAIGRWIFAISKILFGTALTWIVVPEIFAINQLLAGWIGMIGLIFTLHFGLFELLALSWHAAGVNVQPLMLAPIKARALADFWGRRWNTGFHQLAEEFVFHPARRLVGPRVAILIVFAISGLLHDVVISIPARGGYGLPTAYFLIQALGLLFERTRFARRWGLGRGWRGWLFTMIVTAGPAFWLFHPQFLRNS